MKKTTVLLAVLLVVAGIFSACGKDFKVENFIILGEDSIFAPRENEECVQTAFSAGFQVDGKFTGFKDVKWEIISTSDGAGIDADGLMTISEKYNAGDANGNDIIFTATLEYKGETMKAQKTLHVTPAPDEWVDADGDGETQAYEIVRYPEEAKYLFVKDQVLGQSEISIDVSSMITYGTTDTYQVTVRFPNGSIKQWDEKTTAATLTVKLDGAEAVEVSPVFKFAFGRDDGQNREGFIVADTSVDYDGTNLWGYTGTRISGTGMVTFTGSGATSRFVFSVPDGFYNVRLLKGGDGRSTITINGASQGTNVGNPGTGERAGIKPYSYLMEDIAVKGGVFSVGMGEKDRKLAGLEIRRSTTLCPRRIHVYIGGDSTASNYYPIETEEPANGRYQTGWGQVFAQYVTDEVSVTNIAGGGTYAKSWYEMAFPGVVQNGQPGDIFLIQEGINDRSYSNQDEMVDYLTRMIRECREKGIIPVLITSMQTPKFWKDLNGNEVSEFECPEGSGLAPFMDSIRKLASDEKVFLVDNGEFTKNLYGKLGRTYVVRNFHIYKPESNLEEDTLHLCYNGAKNIAGFIATALYNMQKEGCVDATGADLGNLKLNPLATRTYTYINASGEEANETIPMIEAIYKAYAQ